MRANGLIADIDGSIVNEADYDPKLFANSKLELTDEDFTELCRIETVVDKVVEVPNNDKETAITLVAEDLSLADREKFCVINLDENDNVLNINYVSTGDLNSSLIHPREVLKVSLASKASSVIMLHNHPSSDETPSFLDKESTRRLKDVTKMMGIELQEHYIVPALTGKKIGFLKDCSFEYLEITADEVRENLAPYAVKNKRMFVDMDGTLAEFIPVNTLETLYEEGHFLNLKPHEDVVEAVKEVINTSDTEVYILSSCLSDSEYALDEKNAWLDKYLPEIPKENRLFPPCGESKLAWLENSGFKITKADVLLDDYSKNLHEWNKKGTGLKLLNGINATKGTWKQDKISLDEVKAGLKEFKPETSKEEQPKFSPANFKGTSFGSKCKENTVSYDK